MSRVLRDSRFSNGGMYTVDEGCAEIEVEEDGEILFISRDAAASTATKVMQQQQPLPIPTSPRSSMDCSTIQSQQQRHPDEYDNSKLIHPPCYNRSKFALLDVAVDEDDEMGERPDEGVEVPFELMNIFDTFMYSCTGCEPCTNAPCASKKPLEGILKKGRTGTNNNRSLASHPITKRTVSFSQLEIKEFKMSLGDHPCSSTGPPVMLDWESQPTLERVVSLDEYERLRSPRRARNKLRLSYRDRKTVLEEQQGFTSEQVNRAWAEAIKIRQQRHETLQRSPLLNTLDDVYESWQRKCQRAAEAVGIV